MRIIAFAADHAGYRLKESLIAALPEIGAFSARDLGTASGDSVDYPDYGKKAAQAVLRREAEMAVILCGSGIGIAIAANRHPGIRAAVCHDATSARLAREHNDANILSLGARFIGEETAKDALRAFLTTPFGGGRHASRVAKLG